MMTFKNWAEFHIAECEIKKLNRQIEIAGIDSLSEKDLDEYYILECKCEQWILQHSKEIKDIIESDPIRHLINKTNHT